MSPAFANPWIFLREKLKREENSFHKCWKATARTKIPAYSEEELVDW